jgi:predicted nucleic acid-binding protein
MIILDTNVLSELIKISPSQRVVDWCNSYPETELYLTSITQAEILVGIELLPKGRRRAAIAQAAEATFREDFEERILPFDSDAAREFAGIVGARRRRGRPIAQADAQIAAIALACGAVIATRNTGDFEHCGVKVVSPWE